MNIQNYPIGRGLEAMSNGPFIQLIPDFSNWSSENIASYKTKYLFPGIRPVRLVILSKRKERVLYGE